MSKVKIELYAVYYLTQDIVASGDKTITNDSQVVVLELKNEQAHVCRFGNYLDSGWTSISKLSKFKHK